MGFYRFSVQRSGFRKPYMKLNGTIANRKVHRDTILGIEVFRNLKLQAPNSK